MFITINMDGEKFFRRSFFYFKYFYYIRVIKIIKVFVNFDGVFIKSERNSFEPYPDEDGIVMYNTKYCFGPESNGSRRLYHRLYS